MFFKKRVCVFKKQDHAAWKAGKRALKAAGLHPRAGWCETEIVGGCGAKLDPRNFGPRGTIDRNVYTLSVPEEEAARAAEILKK